METDGFYNGVSINKEYIIKEIKQDEHYYRFELYIGDHFISQCYINDMIKKLLRVQGEDYDMKSIDFILIML